MNPDFLDLPWGLSVGEWRRGRVVDMPTGIHRHPVAFVAYEEGIYAIKELPLRLARHEHEMLRSLEERSTPSARPVGLAIRTWADPQDEWSGAVISRYVQFAFPYRELVTGAGFGPRRAQMLDAFAHLLVELHLAGCFWGDCSLSNVLYRYDAAAIEAVMVDAETVRVYPELSNGQRAEDLEIMRFNVAGEMADVAASQGYDLDGADLSLGDDIADRYESLWSELAAVLVVGPEERYRIRERIARLNGLGFAVQDIELVPVEGGDRVSMQVKVGSRTYHGQRLREIVGIDASENQARQLLSDLRYHEAKMGETSPTGKAVSAMRWRTEVVEPLLRRIASIRPALDPVQGYCDFLNHRFILASSQGRDVPNYEAFQSWVEAGLPGYDLEEESTGL